MEFSAPVSSDSSARGGSGTRRISGMEKMSHQKATLTNDSLIAATVSGSPNVGGLRIQRRFTSSSTPPPRNPSAKPEVDTRSSSSGAAMCGSSES